MKTLRSTPAASQRAMAGMGAIVHPKGVFFRVWAPNAKEVFVLGDFNKWKKNAYSKLVSEGNGFWSGNSTKAEPGMEYRLLLHTTQGELWRNDPYARQVNHSNGNSLIYDSLAFDWGTHADFYLRPHPELVLYELHIGTFNAVHPDSPGTFQTALEKIPYLKALGVNALELMPPAEFPGDYSWGYNPAHPFAIETSYGGPDGFKLFVKTCHENGLAVILDVVYNHFGPSDLDLWQFDGWQENNMGGIYFYNDWRSQTPWGNTRPDYGRPEVRRYLRDNALMWLEEFRVDGLRFDMVPYIRTVDANEDPGNQLPDGISLLQEITAEIRQKFPDKILIAEDMHGQDFITAPPDQGGLGFHAQWDSKFVHPVREVLITAFDEQRDLNRLVESLLHRYNGLAFNRVIYTESHDETANGRARLAEDIAPGAADSWHATKRSVLGSVLVLTAPGIPMLFQGQAIHEDGWFADTDPIDWSREEQFAGINQLYTDLIALRLNQAGLTPGLTGDETEILTLDHQLKLLAYARWSGETPHRKTVVILNFSIKTIENYVIRFPEEGQWHVHLNTDWEGYNEQFSNHFSYDPIATRLQDEVAGAPVTIAPYSALILSREC